MLTCPDPSCLTYRYAHRIADDDYLWIVNGTLCDLHDLILDPCTWVRNLYNLKGWKDYAGNRLPPVSLLPNFVINISELKPSATSTGLEPITFQGISGTGIINVQPVRDQSTAIFARDPEFQDVVARMLADGEDGPAGSAFSGIDIKKFKAEWTSNVFGKHVYRTYLRFLHGRLHHTQQFIDGIADDNSKRFFLHKRFLGPGIPASVRSARIACHIVGFALNPQEYINETKGLTQRIIEVPVPLTGAVARGPITLRLPNADPTGVPRVKLTPTTPVDVPRVVSSYMTSSGSTAEVCDAITGDLDSNPATGCVGSITVKDYSGG